MDDQTVMAWMTRIAQEIRNLRYQEGTKQHNKEAATRRRRQARAEQQREDDLADVAEERREWLIKVAMYEEQFGEEMEDEVEEEKSYEDGIA